MIQTTKIPGGPLVIGEDVPGFASVSIGAWAGVGSAAEPAASAGLSHFIEHLLFKGTARRTARQLAEAIEDVGGQINAYTAKEYSCFYAKVRRGDLEVAVDVLGDMLTASLFADDDLVRERSVVLDEIRLAEDDPGDLVHDLFCQTCWPEAPLGRPVFGSRETVAAIDRRPVIEFFDARYQPQDLMVIAAGSVDHQRLVDLTAAHFPSSAVGREGRQAQEPDCGNTIPAFRPAFAYVARPTEQVHMCLGTDGLAIEADDVYALEVANVLIGGGASSRLFQEVREERGLAYDVYSYPSFHRGSGLFTVYASAAPELAAQVMEIILAELRRLATDMPAESEVARARSQLLASLTFGLESSGTRASRIGKSQFYLGRVEAIEEASERIELVKAADVTRIAAAVMAGPYAIVGAGAAKAGRELARIHERESSRNR